MPGKIEIEEKWDAYPCKVDHAPAFMLLNMAYINHAPIAGAPTCYWLSFEIADPGEHGMGVGPCADQLYDLEEQTAQTLEMTELYYVGRLRNKGTWQLMFFGPAGLDAIIDATAAKTIEQHGHVPYEFGSKQDPEWSIYTDFIFPDPERYRWIMDRSVVDQCAKHGDLHDQPRRVDHWMYFTDKAKRDATADACQREGFAIENRPDDNEGERPFGLQVYREDPVELGHIHAVVMLLVELTGQYGGDYDGWETFIVRAEDNAPPT